MARAPGTTGPCHAIIGPCHITKIRSVHHPTPLPSIPLAVLTLPVSALFEVELSDCCTSKKSIAELGRLTFCHEPGTVSSDRRGANQKLHRGPNKSHVAGSTNQRAPDPPRRGSSSGVAQSRKEVGLQHDEQQTIRTYKRIVVTGLRLLLGFISAVWEPRARVSRRTTHLAASASYIVSTIGTSQSNIRRRRAAAIARQRKSLSTSITEAGCTEAIATVPRQLRRKGVFS